jgi:hypothetical protein
VTNTPSPHADFPEAAAGVKPYLVRHWADTPLRIQESGVGFRFAAPKATTLISQRTIVQNGERLSVGIEYRSTLSTPDIESAIEGAKRSVESFNNIASAVSGAAIQTREDVFVLGIEPGVDTRELLQTFSNVLTGLPKTRPLNIDLLSPFIAAVDAAAATNAELIHRALWHLRIAAATMDLIEGFNELWMGLESLNTLLCDKYSLPTKFEARKCKRCGAPMEVFGGSAGITHAITKVANGTRAEAKLARELRKRLQHGMTDVMLMAPNLDRLAPLMRSALILAVADVIGFPQSRWAELIRQPYAIGDSHGTLTVRTTLRGKIDVEGLWESLLASRIRHRWRWSGSGESPITDGQLSGPTRAGHSHLVSSD